MSLVRSITLGQYVHRDSPVHRLDPRTKMLTSLGLMIGLMATRDWRLLALYTLAFCLSVRLAHLPCGLATRNLRPFVWLIVLTVFAQAIFTSGAIVWRVPVLGLDMTREGLVLGLVYGVRLGLLIIFAALLTLTTSPMEIADALDWFLRPLNRFRVPAHDLVMMLTLSLRFVPTLIDEAERIRKAQVSRGARLTGNLRERIQGILPLVVPLFLSAFRKADDLALAMEARCYHGGPGRTSYKRLQYRAADYGVLAGVGILLVLSVAG
ncbi:MAG TPA: energy-coupling factor transporter transmembrane protein EcfT [Bacteroidetes bacterium]|nr:energy-coupling factor transporter transmembrane protein EcfT [Bacteroidota bacterium]